MASRRAVGLGLFAVIAIAGMLLRGVRALRNQQPRAERPRAEERARRAERPAADASAPVGDVSESKPFRARVDRVVDGDTVVLEGGERVRLLGIDAPETDDDAAIVREHAGHATRALDSRADDRDVEVIPGPPIRDVHGRLLAYIEVDGDDAGASLVRDGLARTYPAAHARAESYLALARAAKDAGHGMWEEPVLRALDMWPLPLASPREARDHLGELCRVEGELDTRSRTRGIHVMTLREDGADLKLVIFASGFDELPLDRLRPLDGRRVAVTGRPSIHDGDVQIVLEDPFLLEPLH